MKTQKIINMIETPQLQNIKKFNTGDTVVVESHIKENDKIKIQKFEGIVIAKKNRGLNSSFIVKKEMSRDTVEKTFQSHSPSIKEITIKRKGKIRTSKLYYIRKTTNKSAKIKERKKIKK